MRGFSVSFIRTLIRPLGGAFFTLWVVLTIVFFMVRGAPGGPFEAEKAMSVEQRAQLERVYGLDRPLHEQYMKFLGNFVIGDLGVSYALEGQSVGSIIQRTFPVSLVLGVIALLFAVGVGVPLGFYLASRGRVGLWVYGLAVLPSFVAAPIVQQMTLKMGGVAWGYHGFGSLILPGIVLGLYYLPFIARLAQTGFTDEARTIYLRVAQAKGLTRRRSLWRHGLRAALSPVMAYLGPTAAGLITGAFVVETVWGLPGMGRFFINAVFNRDDTLLLGLVAFYTVILILFNLFIEIVLQGWNPASRKGGAHALGRR